MTLNNEIKALMSYNMVRLLLKLMRSYLSTDELKYIILETFGEVAVQKNSASFIQVNLHLNRLSSRTISYSS